VPPYLFLSNFISSASDRKKAKLNNYTIQHNETKSIISNNVSINGATVGLDRYRAGARYPIPDTIGRIYTDTDSDTDTGLYKSFVLKM